MSVSENPVSPVTLTNPTDDPGTATCSSDTGGRRRIAMLTNLFYPVATGSATQVHGLSRELAARGHGIVVITAHIDPMTPKYEVMDGFEIYRIPALRLPRMSISLNFPWLNWTFWPANLRRIKAIIERHDIDLLHVHNHMFDMAFAGMALKRSLGLPVILTLHTVIKHSVRAFNLLLYPADRGFLRHAVVRHADAVICPDVNICAYLSVAFGREDGTLIPYGISLPDHPGPGVERQIVEHFELAGRRVILSLGHVNALRNRLDLIRAMPAVCARFPNVVLLVVGAVADQRPVNLAKKLGLQDTVIFAGVQPHKHTPVYHQLAELEAMWFDQADGGKNPLGIACMEAMLAGKPVLTVSNVDTFGTGVLVSDRDVVILEALDAESLARTIIDLLDSPETIARIGAAAQRLARDCFAWPKIAAETAAVYAALVPFAEHARGGDLDANR